MEIDGLILGEEAEKCKKSLSDIFYSMELHNYCMKARFITVNLIPFLNHK